MIFFKKKGDGRNQNLEKAADVSYSIMFASYKLCYCQAILCIKTKEIRSGVTLGAWT